MERLVDHVAAETNPQWLNFRRKHSKCKNKNNAEREVSLYAWGLDR